MSARPGVALRLTAGLVAVMVAASWAAPGPPVAAEQFPNLVEGFGEAGSAASRGGYFAFTGADAPSAWSHAKVGEPAVVHWRSAPVPADLAGKPVTFVIPCGLGGEGATILGVPHEVQVNGKVVVAIASSVKSSALWTQGEVRAYFLKLKEDNWGDPFGLLFLALPAGAVEAGKPADLQVVGKGTVGKQGSFFMLSHLKDCLGFVRESGGLAKLLAGQAQVAAAEPHRRPDSVCLTGNAPAELASRNLRVEGRYTYYEGGTNAYEFPCFNPLVPPGPGNLDDGMRLGGWVPFREGKLTDGRLETAIAYQGYLEGIRGHDFVFDFGEEYLIDGIEAHVTQPYVRNVSVYLKSPGEARWTLARTISDQAVISKGFYPKLPSPQRLDVAGSGRWVRVNACFKAGECGFREIQVWGRPLTPGAPRPAKQPVQQAEGRMPVADPQETALDMDLPVCPVPQQFARAEGVFALDARCRVLTPADASERTRLTAKLLADEIRGDTGVALAVGALDGADAPDSGIVVRVGPAGGDLEGVSPQGYVLSVRPGRVLVRGVDELGLFYGTQTLLQLVRASAEGRFETPACDVRDWPVKTWRVVLGSRPPSRDLVRALARFKVTHYGFWEGQHKAGRESSPAARDYMVQFVPGVQFNNAWTRNPKEYVERPADEAYEKLRVGRQNPCPSHPDVWKEYFARLDAVKDIHGDYVNVNMDEMYQPDNGSRWNVCPRCRARNLSGHELMAETIAKIREYLAGMGKKVFVIDSPFWIPGISHPEDKANDWRKAAELLSQKGLAKDIVVYVWHGADLAKRLQGLGFTALHWSVATPPTRIPDGYDGDYLSLSDSPFRPPFIMAMVQRSWSPDRLLPGAPACTMLNEAGMVTFNRVWTGRTEPSRRPGAQFAPIDLRPAANRSLRDDAPGDGKGWADLGPNYDLRALKPGRRVLAGAPFDILDGDRACVMVHNRLFFNRELPSRVEIPVGRQAASIVFLHSLDSRAGQNYHQKRELAGYYFMVYDDGTYHPMEIKYGINAANFDGLVTYWDYSPRGDTMEKAALAWRGQMGCGIEAALYRAEWVNPFPAKKIERILFASSWKPCAFNPILVAATAVLPTPQDIENPPKPAETWDVPGKVRRVESLSPPEPKGRPMDLTNGECETDTRWRARDGIVVEFDGEPANATKLAYALIPFWTRIPCALYDNAEFLRPKDGGKPLTITLPQPRRLAGVLFLAAYRHEKDNTDADHRPSRCNYEVAFSPDGTAWTTVATRSLYVAEEDGPQWVPLPDQPVKAVRINMTGGGKFAFVQPYEPTDATPPGRP